jgi:two-component system, cell cycle sensor histidine kinase and response regulator CckA
MPESIENRYDDLLSTVNILRRENELLAERTKDVFLLTLVSEALAAAAGTDDILMRSLERISILKDICYSAFCSTAGGRTATIASWSNFGSGPDDSLVLPPALLGMLSGGPVVFGYEEFTARGGVLTIAYPRLTPSALLLVACTTLEHGTCVFLFADARRSKADLTPLRYLFARIADLAVARLDSVAHVKERTLADQTLEMKIDARTAELNESLRQYKHLFDNAPDAFFLIEVEGQNAGKIIQANHAAAEMHGYTPDEMTGMNLFDIENVDPSLGIQEQMDRLFTGATISIETIRTRKSGSRFTVESVRKSVEVGGKLYVLCFDRDITGRKREQEAVRQTQKMESLSILAGGIAHDFNNILQGIVGYTSLMLLKSAPDASVKQNVEAIATEAGRASQLTKQLLSYAGSGMFQMRPVNLNTLIRENYQFMKMRMPKGVNFVTNYYEPLPEISADAVQLQEAIMNSVTNAAEAIGDKEGTIAIETAVCDMTTAMITRWKWSSGDLAPGQYVLLSISDTGCGMDEPTLARIFDPFFTTKFTGRGLGLAAVLGIVRGHQGGIAVESSVGKGARFLFAFPVIITPEKNVPADVVQAAPEKHVSVEVVQAAPEKHASTDVVHAAPQAYAPPASAVSAERKSAGKVLVIDDERTVRELITDILESVSVDVTQATDGLDGIAAYVREQHEIDLVMLDLSMPGMSGDKVFQKLREINPAVKVILSSGYAEDDVQKRYATVRVDGYLQKPFTTRTLISKIQSCLPE